MTNIKPHFLRLRDGVFYFRNESFGLPELKNLVRKVATRPVLD
jgi:hypothetical protein